jgi:tetratricopeptide (TPR) repeat protein
LAATPDAEVFLDRAILEYDEKNYPAALEYLNRALAQDPDFVLALYQLGLTHLALGEPARAVESLQKARTLDPENRDVAYQLGVALFSLERYREAEPHFLAVYAAQPERENLGYYLGAGAFQRGDYRTALGFLRRNRSSEPRFQQLATYYAGLCQHFLGLSDEAAEELSRALTIDPASPLSAQARRYVEAAAKARQEERRLRLEARLNLQFDSNVPVVPTTNVFGLRDRKKASTGELLFLRGDYVLIRDPRYEGTLGYAVTQVVNNDIRDFDLTDQAGIATWLYRGRLQTMPYFAGVQYMYDFLTLKYNKFLQRHSVTPYFSLVESPSHLTTVLYRFQAKDFFRDPTQVNQENRDALNHMVGLVHYLRFAQDRHYLKAGYQYEREFAKGIDYRYGGHKAIAGFLVTLPAEFRLSATGEFFWRRYPKENYIFEVTRREFEKSVSVTLAKDLPHGLTASVEYFGDFNDSKLAIFDYKRHIVSMGLSWKY